MAEGFEVRGVIEGFYGMPWSADARRRVIAFLARHGMNAYVYAPKDDPYHRRRWREPYPDDQLAALLALHEQCAGIGVRFGFAISPGLDFQPDSASDRDALWAKLEPFAHAGVDWFVLAFDDIPLEEGAGRSHGELAGWLRGRLPVDARVSLVPTDYVGSARSPYLDELADALPAGTDLMWTGSTVVPATITASEARDRVAATGGFPLLIWDNYPVNDAFMDASLHLGPLRGRDPELVDVAAGLLANPMTQPLASMIPLSTVAAYLGDPAGYDPEAAWDDATADVALELGAEPRPIAVLAAACSASRLVEPDDDHLSALLTMYDLDPTTVVDTFEAVFADAESLPDSLPGDLLDEVRPWAEQAAREAGTGRAALSVLRGPDGDDWKRVMAVMGMLLMWSAARRTADRVVFGPRFACYPAIVQDADGRVHVDPDAAVVEDANTVDRLCRLALDVAGARP